MVKPLVLECWLGLGIQPAVRLISQFLRFHCSHWSLASGSWSLLTALSVDWRYCDLIRNWGTACRIQIDGRLYIRVLVFCEVN